MTMIRKRDREATKKRILCGAEAVIVADGFGAFGINRVAQAAECDKVLIYRYFKDLKGVLTALAEAREFFPEWSAFLDRHKIPEAGTESRISDIIDRYLEEIAARPLTCQALRWLPVADNPVTRAAGSARERFIAGISDALDIVEEPASFAVTAAGHLQRYLDGLSGAAVSVGPRDRAPVPRSAPQPVESAVSQRVEVPPGREADDPNTLPTELL